MYLTKSDYDRIYDAMVTRGIKDSEFPLAKSLDGSESVPLLQEGENRNMNVLSMVLQALALLLETSPQGFYLFESGTFTDIILAAESVPKVNRLAGLTITFNNGTKWVVYQYTGTNTDNWANSDYWVDRAIVADLVNQALQDITDLKTRLNNVEETSLPILYFGSNALASNYRLHNMNQQNNVQKKGAAIIYRLDIELGEVATILSKKDNTIILEVTGGLVTGGKYIKYEYSTGELTVVPDLESYPTFIKDYSEDGLEIQIGQIVNLPSDSASITLPAYYVYTSEGVDTLISNIEESISNKNGMLDTKIEAALANADLALELIDELDMELIPLKKLPVIYSILEGASLDISLEKLEHNKSVINSFGVGPILFFLYMGEKSFRLVNGFKTQDGIYYYYTQTGVGKNSTSYKFINKSTGLITSKEILNLPTFDTPYINITQEPGGEYILIDILDAKSGSSPTSTMHLAADFAKTEAKIQDLQTRVEELEEIVRELTPIPLLRGDYVLNVSPEGVRTWQVRSIPN